MSEQFDPFNMNSPETRDMPVITAEVPVMDVEAYQTPPEDTGEVDAPEYIDAEYEESEPEQDTSPIPDRVVQATYRRDGEVRGRYANASSKIDTVDQEVHRAHQTTTKNAERAIERTNKEFEEYLNLLNYSRESTIAAINEAYARKVEAAKMQRMLRIEADERLIEDSKKRLDANLEAIAQFRSEIDDGLTTQDKHERRRISASDKVQDLSAELVQKKKDLAAAEDSVERLQAQLYQLEIRERQLNEEVGAAKAEERIERDKIAQPQIKMLYERIGYQEGMEQPDQLKIAIKRIKQDVVPTVTLSRIMGEVADAERRHGDNARNMQYTVETIDSTRLTIRNLKARIAEASVELEDELEKFKQELMEYSPRLEDHSLGFEDTAKALDAINKGDVSALSGRSLHPSLRPVWDSVVNFQRALTQHAESSQEYEWPELEFNAEMPLPLRESEDDEAYDVADLAQMKQNTDRLEHELDNNPFNIGDKIRRGLGRVGARFTYRERE